MPTKKEEVRCNLCGYAWETIDDKWEHKKLAVSGVELKVGTIFGVHSIATPEDAEPDENPKAPELVTTSGFLTIAVIVSKRLGYDHTRRYRAVSYGVVKGLKEANPSFQTYLKLIHPDFAAYLRGFPHVPMPKVDDSVYRHDILYRLNEGEFKIALESLRSAVTPEGTPMGTSEEKYLFRFYKRMKFSR